MTLTHIDYAGHDLMRPAEHPDPAHWERIRKQALERDGNQCRGCPATAAEGIRLEVHHRHYRNWGHEELDDLTTFCVDCHDLFTSRTRGARYAERSYPDSCYCSIVPELKETTRGVADIEDEIEGGTAPTLP